MLTLVIPVEETEQLRPHLDRWRPYAHDTPDRPWAELRVVDGDWGESPHWELRLQVTRLGGALQEHAVWWDTTAPGGNPFLDL